MTRSTRPPLGQIAQLTEAAFAARQARMGALKREEQDVRIRLLDLDAGRHGSADVPLEDNAALRAGADLLWQTWCQTRRNALNQMLARNLVAQAREKHELARTFGRSTVANSLRDRARQAARKENEAREERQSDQEDAAD